MPCVRATLVLLLDWPEVSLQMLLALYDFHGSREGQEADAEACDGQVGDA